MVIIIKSVMSIPQEHLVAVVQVFVAGSLVF